MKRTLLTISFIIIFFIAGCATLDRMFIPRGDQSKSDFIAGVDDVGIGTVMVGGPYALPVLAVTNLLSIIGGIYASMRKKQQILEAEDKYGKTRTVTEAIIKAIEDSENIVIDDNGTTLKGFLKEKVGDKLKNKDFYIAGKAIIDAIKREGQ